MKSKLLIVTTFYNESERLKFTLENMLNMDTTDFVHLIIDDGSKDDSSDKIVHNYISQSKHKVIFEKHTNVGINMVHMLAFKRTMELGCTHFMWLDCGDGLEKNAITIINKNIEKMPYIWLHLDGHYVSDDGATKVRMSSKSYLPYLKKTNQLIPFCFSISTYGHFVIPFEVYQRFNPDFELADGFYYDAQIIGALSLNSCPHYFINKPLSIIEDDRHFSVTNKSGRTYRDNLLILSESVVFDDTKKERISKISLGMNLISIRGLLNNNGYFANRAKIVELKKFYKSNGIGVFNRYKWLSLIAISALHLC